ncbi:hypothetical protein OCK72_08940 [Fusobacterium simiae]|uniref:Uncharacterized protein n=1 Tax=Fusobacterium simiae TaxID=855 RepID=A0ABT4DN84_FUSSI|nr:hypothetical protein [Fusobacterium simiae]MCY7008749.1 hypothetical protein [Fusobacterium simiae]
MMLEDFGMLTELMPENAVQYDLRAIIAYCREKNISTEELSEEELKKFELPKNKSVANF